MSLSIIRPKFLDVPRQIAGLQLWLRADKGTYQDETATTPAVAQGDPVGRWNNQSVSWFLSAPTTSKRPTLQLGANGINSKPALLFDGTDDILNRVGSGSLNYAVGSVFAVFKVSSALPSQTIFSSSCEAVATKYFQLCAYNSGYLTLRQSNADTEDRVRGDTAIATGTAYIVEFLSNGSAYTLKVNNVAQSLTVESGANSGDWTSDTSDRDNLTVGCQKVNTERYQLQGLLAEVILYDSLLSANNLARVENYLNTRYALY